MTWHLKLEINEKTMSVVTDVLPAFTPAAFLGWEFLGIGGDPTDFGVIRKSHRNRHSTNGALDRGRTHTKAFARMVENS
jgi:hypothetical protein